MTWRDRLVQLLGGRPAGPARGHRRRTFKAAEMTRLTRDWLGGTLSADAELSSDLATLRGRSRELARDNPHGAALTRVWVDNVAGPNGLQHFPLITRPDGSLDSRSNARLRAWWQDWGRRGTCSRDRLHSWRDIERLAVRSEFVDGEFLALEHVGDPADRHGYSLQLLDPDQLDATFNRAPSKSANEIRMGVEVDAFGAPVAFHLWPRHPNDLTLRERRDRIVLPADRVLHYFEPLRPGQTRGYPRLTPSLYRLKMLDGYDEAELVTSRLAANKGIVYEQSPDHPIEDGDGQDVGEIPEDTEPGMGDLLPIGVTAKLLDPTHPSGVYESFVRATQMAIGAGPGIAYHAFTGNLTQANYSSLRQGELQQRDVYRAAQQRLAMHLTDRVYRHAMEQAILAGTLQMRDPDFRRWAPVRFVGRGWSWVDPLKDISAASMELALRLNTRSAIARENSRSFEDLLQEWDQDLALAKEWGIPLPDPLPTGVQAGAGATPTPEDGNDKPLGS